MAKQKSETRNLRAEALAAVEQRRTRTRTPGKPVTTSPTSLPEDAIDFAEWEALGVLVTDDPRWGVYHRWAVGEPGGVEVRVRQADPDDDDDRWVVLLCLQGSKRPGIDTAGTKRNPLDHGDALRLAHASWVKQDRARRRKGKPAPWE